MADPTESRPSRKAAKEIDKPPKPPEDPEKCLPGRSRLRIMRVGVPSCGIVYAGPSRRRTPTWRRTTATAQAESLLLRGRQLRIEIVTEPTRRRYAMVEQQGQTIHVRVPDDGRVGGEKALEPWLRRQARSDIMARLTVRAAQMKVQPGRVYIMGQKTRWGGCSRRRNLSFNWRLVMAPPAALDYIVVHELAHLVEPYHSTRFWLIVRSHCPDFDASRSWLRDNQEPLGIRR
jgi:predicted metal-dependent hydrolase